MFAGRQADFETPSLQLPVFLPRVERRAGLADVRAELAVAEDFRFRIVPPELAEQVEQGALLGAGAGVCGTSRLVQPPLVADADAVVVPPGGMRPDLVGGAAAVDVALARDVEMVADVGKASCLVRSAQGLHREVAVVARRAAMDHQEAHLPVILVETPRRHNVQALMPSAPATALAMAMTTLRMTPQTDFFSFFCSMMIYDL